MSIINKDFRLHLHHDRHPRLRWLLFATGCAVLGVVLANTSGGDSDALPLVTRAHLVDAQLVIKQPEERVTRESFQLTLPELQAQQDVFDELNNVAPQKWREFKVKKGDNLARLFKRARIQPQQLDAMMKSGSAVKHLRKIFPKDIIRVLTDDNGVLQALRYEINHDEYLIVERKDGILVANKMKQETEVRVTHAYGEIDSSLFLAGKEAGVSQNIIMELAGIFGWDIDFVLDIRKGDRFVVIYEELYRNGEKLADGNILSAEFINNKKTYRAVRYTNPQTNRTEYFTKNGKSMRKAFLRSPVNFARISSRFSTRRFHPSLHKFRAHKGVDYAARTGTKIRAAGDGKVIYRGVKGGYGRVVIVKHGSRYSTLYAHMSRYARKIRVGTRVRQGQTIGYVGKSGLATGPHLHYEFRVNGVHRNPLTVKLPSSKPVPDRYMLDFEIMTAPALAQLDILTRTQLALNSEEGTNQP